MRKQVRLDELEFVDEDEVPKKPIKHTPWEKLLGSIPRGKAIVIPEDKLAVSTVRSALKRYQDKGQFSHLYSTTRKDAKGKYKTYIVNPSEEPESEDNTET